MGKLFTYPLETLHAFLVKLPAFSKLYKSINRKTLRRREFAGCFGLRVILITWLATPYLLSLTYGTFFKTAAIYFGMFYFTFSLVSYFQMESEDSITIPGGKNEK